MMFISLLFLKMVFTSVFSYSVIVHSSRFLTAVAGTLSAAYPTHPGL